MLTKKIIADTKLLHTKKGRADQGRCVVEGIRAVTTCLESGMEAVHGFLTSAWKDHPAYRLLWASVPHLMVVGEHDFARLSAQQGPSGVLVVFKIPRPLSTPFTHGVVIAGLQDPGNVGTIIRTVQALGAGQIIMVDSVDVWNPKVIQATAGTIAGADIRCLSWHDVHHQIGSDRLVALVPRGGDAASPQFRTSFLVVGNEGEGLPSAWQADCGHLLTLPMPSGAVESLNAAIATSIALYMVHAPTDMGHGQGL